MANTLLLKEKISESGMTVKAIAIKTGILRETLYNKMSGKSEFTASEIVALSELLKLSKDDRDNIFLQKKLN